MKFEYFKFPFSIKDAERHKKASRFGRDKVEKDYCKCCGFNVNNIKFNIFSEIKDFKINGIGYYMYFKFY